MVGYLAHCLRSEENLLQQDSKDPRTWFSDYRRFQGKSDLPASAIKERLDDFNTGWGQLGYPLGNNIYIKEAPPEFEIVQ
jgi:hypothetical protein